MQVHYNPIALVEAPKTAIYGTLYFGFPEQPKDLLWLAVYNLSSLNIEKCRPLKGRNVYLFPDLSAYDKWKKDSEAIQKQLQGTYFYVSDLLEQKATEQDKNKGKDLADYLILQDWRLFRNQNNTRAIPKPLISEKGEKSEPLKKSIFLQQEHKPKTIWQKLDNATRKFWNTGGRGGFEAWYKHNTKFKPYL